MEVVTGADFGGKEERWRNLQSVRTSWGRTLLVSDYNTDHLLNWRLRNEDGTPLPTSCFFDLTHGVMTMDQSEESEEDDDVNDYSGDLYCRW